MWLQGKPKDSGWGSDDEAVSLAATAADNVVASKPVSRKPVASAFDLLDEASEQQDDASPTSALDDIEEPANGRLHDDQSDNDNSITDEDDQVRVPDMVQKLK